jgi:hypothetical protein
MAEAPTRCLLCWDSNIIVKVIDVNTVVIACRACLAVIKVEILPPAGHSHGGRIDLLLPPKHRPTLH